MARWGRSTDIEYVYKRFTKAGAATVQAKDHVESAFKGEHDHNHPLLMPVTDNNMIAAASKDLPCSSAGAGACRPFEGIAGAGYGPIPGDLRGDG